MCPLIVTFLNNVKYFWSTFWYTTIYSLEELLHFLLHFFQSQNRRLVDNPCHVQSKLPPKRKDNHGQSLFKTLSKSFSRPFLRASKQVRSQTTAKIPLSMLLRRKISYTWYTSTFQISTDPKAGAEPALPLLLRIGTSHSAFKQFLKFQLQPNFSTRNGEKTLLLILLSIVGKSDFSSKVLILIFKSSFPKSLEYFSVLLVFFHFS